MTLIVCNIHNLTRTSWAVSLFLESGEVPTSHLQEDVTTKRNPTVVYQLITFTLVMVWDICICHVFRENIKTRPINAQSSEQHKISKNDIEFRLKF